MHDNHEDRAVPGGACGCPPERFWVLPAALILVLAGVVAFRTLWRVEAPPGSAADGDAAAVDRGSETTSGPPSARPEGKTVSLAIDFGNGAGREFAALAWRDGMTVADLMGAASQFRPPLVFSGRGEGELTFITTIEGISSEGREGRNWILSIGGEKSPTGAGGVSLQPGDAVLWKYEAYE